MSDQGSGAADGTIVVNSLSDQKANPLSGVCTLREAIGNANSPGIDTSKGNCPLGTGNDVISFSVSGTIVLTSTLPSILNTLSIEGTGQNITIDGNGQNQIFLIYHGATLTL
ncbi:MAG TPA: hypothetical protein VEJ86_02635, partial [Candidatus Binataceae bacterium]|nr:hypothetical protein [Candidatus Binataceae bacterium]